MLYPSSFWWSSSSLGGKLHAEKTITLRPYVSSPVTGTQVRSTHRNDIYCRFCLLTNLYTVIYTVDGKNVMHNYKIYCLLFLDMVYTLVLGIIDSNWFHRHQFSRANRTEFLLSSICLAICKASASSACLLVRKLALNTLYCKLKTVC